MLVGCIAREPGDAHVPLYSTTKVRERFGINLDDYDLHTALGNCRWAKALFKAIIREDAE